MRLIADAHVHVYPGYRVKEALDTLRLNLAALDPQALCMAFLAERSDCRFFAQFSEQALPVLGPSARAEQGENVILLKEDGYPDLYIFAGRQIITAEKVEILALTSDIGFAEGLPAGRTVVQIREAGAVPVVSWAPGKWFFRRRHVVLSLLQEQTPGQLLVGDTSLRPRIWLLPLLMRHALRQGFGMVAGSDPLPFPGEERMLGSYAMSLEGPFAEDDPVGSMRRILCTPGLMPGPAGKRGSVFFTLRRLYRNARQKKRKASSASGF